MPRITFNPRLTQLVKSLHRLGEEAEEIGHALKDIAISLASEDLDRVAGQIAKRDSRANGRAKEPTP
jgi:hypothetical protein